MITALINLTSGYFLSFLARSCKVETIKLIEKYFNER